jgi:hypothetical protein
MLEINASIAVHQEKIWCTYRAEHLYNYNARTMLTELDADLQLVKDLKLVAENKNTAFEDVRLFSAGQRLLALYTYLPQDDAGGWKWEPGVGVGYVDVESGIITSQVSLRGLSKRKHEKNWCPYVVGDEIFLITDFDPYVRVLKLGKVDGEIMPEEVYQSTIRTKGWRYGELRGGTPLLQSPQGEDCWHYGFIHSFLNSYQGYARYYFYTAVRFNHYTHEVEYHPEPLDFEYDTSGSVYQELWWYSNRRNLKVIFPIGIMPHEDGVLVSFGIDDVASAIQHYSWDYLCGLFVKT